MSDGVASDVERKMMSFGASLQDRTASVSYEIEQDRTPIEAELIGLGNDINELNEHIGLLKRRLLPVLNSQDVEQATVRRGMLTDDSRSDHVKALIELRNRLMSLIDDLANISNHLDI